MDTGNKLDERLEEILGTHHHSGTVNEIKQAFIDDGWINTGITKEAKQQINMMTGQEYYDRFEKDYVARLVFHGSEIDHRAIESAKKAAGIE